jgi:hypothetical protein
MKRTALLDGDVLVYRCGFAAQHTEYYIYDKTMPEFGWVAMYRYMKEAKAYINGIDDYYIKSLLVVEPVENAIHNLKASIRAAMTNTRSDTYELYLSGENNFRESIATIRPYKGKRDPNAKPVHYNALREYCLLQYNATIVDNQEADDALGIRQFPTWEKENTVICTIDKDLDMIPGKHYNFSTKEHYWVDNKEATYNFYKQLLMGDVTDNIVGVPGIGKKGATSILEGCETEGDMYAAVWGAYQNAYTEADIHMIDAIVLENARLLWIRREPDQLWNPPEL